MATPIPGVVIGRNPTKVRVHEGGVHIINNTDIPTGTAVWLLWDCNKDEPAGIVKKDELLSRIGELEEPTENENLDYLEDLEVASLPLSGPGFLEDEDWDLEL